MADIEEDEGDYRIPSYYAAEEYTLSEEKAKELQRRHRLSQKYPLPPLQPLNEGFLTPRNNNVARFGATRDLTPTVRSPDLAATPPTPLSPSPNDALLPPNAPFSRNHGRSASGVSMLSVDSVVGDKKDFKLQKVDPFFTDSTGEYYKAFDNKLKDLDGKTSEGQLCIEDYLVKSERKWFNKFRDARLGRTPGHTRPGSPAASMFKKSRPPSPTRSIFHGESAFDKSEAAEVREVYTSDEEPEDDFTAEEGSVEGGDGARGLAVVFGEAEEEDGADGPEEEGDGRTDGRHGGGVDDGVGGGFGEAGRGGFGEGAAPVPEGDDVGLLRALDDAGAVDPGFDGGAAFVAEVQGKKDGAAGGCDGVHGRCDVLDPSPGIYTGCKVGESNEQKLFHHIDQSKRWQS